VERFKFSRIRSKISIVLIFTLPLFFIFLADSILSYIFPIVVEQKLNSNLLMGIVMSASSVIGVVCDLSFAQLLKERTWKFQLISGIIVAVSFPIILHISELVAAFALFLLASMLWGIYYELLLFAQQEFIVTEEKTKSYSRDWGIVFGTIQLTWITGPIIGSLLLQQISVARTVIVITLQVIALIFTFILIFFTPYHHKVQLTKSKIKSVFNLFRELGYWKILSRAILPVLIMGIMTEIIEATFWTIGGLFGREVTGSDGFDWIIFTAFSVPLIIGSMILARLDIHHHKKLLSQLALLVCGVLLAMVYFSKSSTGLLLIIVAVSSLFFAFASPLNEAVYSDLIGRIGGDKQLHLLGLAKANSSVAYIITPIIVGFLADRTGYHSTFALVGVFAIVISVVLLVISPRKIHLPEREIKTFE
jgi:MFS family permease